MAVKKKKQKQEYPIFNAIIKQTLKRPVVKEYRFHPKRLWRFDFAVPELMIAVEIEGAIFSKQRLGHSSGTGIKRIWRNTTWLNLWAGKFFDICRSKPPNV